MVIDSSALLAILLDEPERQSFNRKLAADPIRLMSAANYLETAIIIDDRLGEEGARDLKLYLAEAAIRIMPVTIEQAETARAAYRRFGRGNHSARLNFGDCFAYFGERHGRAFVVQRRGFSTDGHPARLKGEHPKLSNTTFPEPDHARS